MQSQSIHELVRRAQENDHKAFQELVERYRPRLERQVQCRMGSKVRSRLEASDVLQETLTTAFESIEVFKWKGEESFYRWLASIAEHLIRNVSRKKAWSHLEVRDDVPAKGVSPSKNLRRNERFDRLEQALLGLSEDVRTALVLARVEGLKVKQIAERMSRSEAAVHKLLARGVLQLKRSFGDTESLNLPDRAFEIEDRTDER